MDCKSPPLSHPWDSRHSTACDASCRRSWAQWRELHAAFGTTAQGATGPPHADAHTLPDNLLHMPRRAVLCVYPHVRVWAQGDFVAEYMGPEPGRGTHRYAILLFEQPGFQEIVPPTKRAYFKVCVRVRVCVCVSRCVSMCVCEVKRGC